MITWYIKPTLLFYSLLLGTSLTVLPLAPQETDERKTARSYLNGTVIWHQCSLQWQMPKCWLIGSVGKFVISSGLWASPHSSTPGPPGIALVTDRDDSLSSWLPHFLSAPDLWANAALLSRNPPGKDPLKKALAQQYLAIYPVLE